MSAYFHRPMLVALGCAALSLTVFSPRLWLLRDPVPGSFQWDRGLTFLKQVEDPFRRDIEPAMLWRQAPALFCHYTGLRGRLAFLFPWLGALTATVYVATVAARHNSAPRFVWGCTLLYASSSALLVPTHWWGVNDGWMWLGLLAAAFGRGRVWLIVSLLLCPWVDERFIIALPLALLLRGQRAGEKSSWRHLLPLAWILPYLIVRLVSSGSSNETATANFLHDQKQVLPSLVAIAPLGWWMAFRGGWLPVGYAVARSGWGTGVVAGGTLLLCFALASDISRSAAVLAPLLLAGCFEWHRHHPADSAAHVWRLALLNLLLPAAHIVHQKIDLISPLPVELVRLWRVAG